MPFADVNKIRQALKAAQPDCEVRQFKGDGTHELLVPGLKTLEYVRVGNQVLPLTKEWTYRLDSAGTKRKTEVLPFVQLETDEDGKRYLLRCISSNNGRWQKGTTIYIGGEWDAPASAEAAVKEPLTAPKAPGEPVPPPKV